MSFRLRITILFAVVSSLLYLFNAVVRSNFDKVASDEKYYMEMVKFVGDQGVFGYQKIVDYYAADEKNRFNPAPTRLGFIFPLVLLFKLIPPGYLAIYMVSYVSFALFVIFAFYYCRKFFDENIALGYVMILSVSPVMMGMARSGLTDSLANLLWGMSLWLFLDFTANKAPRSYVLLLIVLSWALLVRESTIFLILVLLVSVGIFNLRFNGAVSVLRMHLLWAIPLISAFVVYFVMVGMDAAYLVKMIHAIYMTHFVDQANPYALKYCSGPWSKYIIDFMLLSPAVTMLSIGYICRLLVNSREIEWQRFFLMFYLISMYSLLSLFPHSKVIRFAMNLDMVLCLFAVLMIWEIFRKEIHARSFIEYFAVIVILFALSFVNFYRLFIAHGRMADPITRNLLIRQGIINGPDLLNQDKRVSSND